MLLIILLIKQFCYINQSQSQQRSSLRLFFISNVRIFYLKLSFIFVNFSFLLANGEEFQSMWTLNCFCKLNKLYNLNVISSNKIQFNFLGISTIFLIINFYNILITVFLVYICYVVMLSNFPFFTENQGCVFQHEIILFILVVLRMQCFIQNYKEWKRILKNYFWRKIL